MQNGVVDIGAVETTAPDIEEPTDNSALIASLKSKIKALKKKQRDAKRAKKLAKAKRLGKSLKRLQRQLRAL